MGSSVYRYDVDPTSPRKPAPLAKRSDPRRQEEELRMLAAWYEWAEPPNLIAAAVLQDAADALRVRALSEKAADALITVWQPFVGLEARVGNAPSTLQPENAELDALRVAVSDLGQMLRGAKTPAGRRFLTKLLNQQIALFESATKTRNRGSC